MALRRAVRDHRPAGLALLVVYILGGQTQIEGVLLAVALGGPRDRDRRLGPGAHGDAGRHRDAPPAGGSGGGGGGRGGARRGGRLHPPPAARRDASRGARRSRRGARDPGPVARAGARAELFSTAWRTGSGSSGSTASRSSPPICRSTRPDRLPGGRRRLGGQPDTAHPRPARAPAPPAGARPGRPTASSRSRRSAPTPAARSACFGRASGCSSARATSRRSTS